MDKDIAEQLAELHHPLRGISTLLAVVATLCFLLGVVLLILGIASAADRDNGAWFMIGAGVSFLFTGLILVTYRAMLIGLIRIEKAIRETRS